MTAGAPAAALPALADSAATPADSSRSPVRGPAGRGRGSITPAWKKQGPGSEPPSPSIPKGEEDGAAVAPNDTNESATDLFGSVWKESEKESSWKEDSGWGTSR